MFGDHALCGVCGVCSHVSTSTEYHSYRYHTDTMTYCFFQMMVKGGPSPSFTAGFGAGVGAGFGAGPGPGPGPGPGLAADVGESPGAALHRLATTRPWRLMVVEEGGSWVTLVTEPGRLDDRRLSYHSQVMAQAPPGTPQALRIG